MTNQTQQLIKELQSVRGISLISTNNPSEYKDYQTQYMANRNSKFVNERAKYSSDFVKGLAQGLTDDFYHWNSVNLRLSDVSTGNATTVNSKKNDDYKRIMFESEHITYFPLGAKLQTMGSTWLCINPSNISAPKGTQVVARCNASYNSFDEYGNIVTEPIVIERANMLGNANATPLNLELMDGYFNVTCQLNSNTQKLGQNKRIILGTKVYSITGFTDFIQEFSGDRNSSHVLSFTVRLEEPTENDDVTTYFTADSKYTDFQATVDVVSELRVGETSWANARFFVKNEESLAPVTWKWKSSNNAVAIVDDNGVVTAVAPGAVTIQATLTENPNVTAFATLDVVERESDNYIQLVSDLLDIIPQYQTATVTAKHYVDGVQHNDTPFIWRTEGLESAFFGIQISEDTSTAKITCLKPSDTPLIVTATIGEVSGTLTFELEGY